MQRKTEMELIGQMKSDNELEFMDQDEKHDFNLHQSLKNMK